MSPESMRVIKSWKATVSQWITVRKRVISRCRGHRGSAGFPRQTAGWPDYLWIGTFPGISIPARNFTTDATVCGRSGAGRSPLHSRAHRGRGMGTESAGHQRVTSAGNERLIMCYAETGIGRATEQDIIIIVSALSRRLAQLPALSDL